MSDFRSDLKERSDTSGCRRPIALQSHSDVSLNVLGIKIKVSTTGVIFDVKSPGVIDLRTWTRLSIIENLALTMTTI